MEDNSNKGEKIANWVSFASAFVSILALSVSIKSCNLADNALVEASEPDFVVKNESDHVLLANEGKGVGKVIKIAYKSKTSEDLKCLKNIKLIAEVNESYKVYDFDVNEAIKPSGSQVFIKCKNGCQNKVHKNYVYYVYYKGKYKQKSYYTTNTSQEIVNKMENLSCPK